MHEFMEIFYAQIYKKVQHMITQAYARNMNLMYFALSAISTFPFYGRPIE